MVRTCHASHFVPAYVCSDVLVERGELPIRPVLLKDDESQRVAFKDAVVERGHRVWVVARAAHHAAKFLADFLNDEDLLRRSDTESQPHSDHILLGQLRLPWPWLDVGQAVRAIRVSASRVRRNRRSLWKNG